MGDRCLRDTGHSSAGTYALDPDVVSVWVECSGSLSTGVAAGIVGRCCARSCDLDGVSSESTEDDLCVFNLCVWLCLGTSLSVCPTISLAVDSK